MEDFLRAEHHGQFLWLLGRRDGVIEGPIPFERDLVEKAQGGNGDENGTRGQLLFGREVDLIGTDFLESQLQRGFVEVPCEQGDLLQIGSLRIQGETPHLHVFGHSLPKWCHSELLCEMECAASSNSMLPHWSTIGGPSQRKCGLTRENISRKCQNVVPNEYRNAV